MTAVVVAMMAGLGLITCTIRLSGGVRGSKRSTEQQWRGFKEDKSKKRRAARLLYAQFRGLKSTAKPGIDKLPVPSNTRSASFQLVDLSMSPPLGGHRNPHDRPAPELNRGRAVGIGRCPWKSASGLFYTTASLSEV